MSSFVLCPDCKRNLKVPETAVGKTIRCPACKTLIPPASEPRPAASDPDSAEPDNPSPPVSVTAAPSLRTAATLSPQPQPSQDEEPEDNVEPASAKPIRKKSSAGLIIGLVVGGVFLLLAVGGIGAGLLWYFLRDKTIPEAEWQSFSPPNSGCTVVMPGSPISQKSNMLGVMVTQYEVERKKENAHFAVSFFDVPPQALRPNLLEDIANSSRDGALARMNGGKATSETSISLGNLPGREYQVKPPIRGMFIGRVYLAKIGATHRVYVVVAGGDYIEPNKSDAARFFDSFQVTAPATPPELGRGPVAQKPQPPGINPPIANPPRVNPKQKPPRKPRPGREPLPGERAVWNETSGTQAIALAFSPDSATLAVGHWDKKLRLWDVAGSTDRKIIPLDIGPARAVAFSKDGTRLAIGADNGRVLLWDPAASKEVGRFQVLHARAKDQAQVKALAFAADGKLLAVGIVPNGSSNAEVHLWDLEANKELAALRDCQESTAKLAFTADGILVVLPRLAVKLCDAATLQVRQEFKPQQPGGQFVAAAVSSDGQTLATLGDDKNLKLWRLSSGECLQTWPVKADVIRHSYFPLEFSPDDKLLALGGRGPNLYLWNAQTGQERKMVRVGQSAGFVDLLAFSPDGQLLAVHGTSGPKILEVAKLLPGN